MNVAVEAAELGLQHDGAEGVDGAGGVAGHPSQNVDGLVVVRVSGDVDISTSSQLWAVLTDLLRPAAPTPVAGGIGSGTDSSSSAGSLLRGLIIDLREVDFMDSSGLGVLVHAHKLTRPHRLGYAVVANSVLITKMFEITGLAKIMPLHPDVAAAVSALRPAC